MARLWGMAAAAFLALAATGTAGANEPGGEALVVVKGVVSPGSSFGLLKNLGAIKGVADVRFNLLHGLADVRLQPGAVVTDDQLRAAVRSASYTPGGITWKPATAARGN